MTHRISSDDRSMTKEISAQRLEMAYHKSAEIVSIYGEKYLPIFERIENEYQKRNKLRDTFNRAIDIAKSAKPNIK